jgi:hypothetical protein
MLFVVEMPAGNWWVTADIKGSLDKPMRIYDDSASVKDLVTVI